MGDCPGAGSGDWRDYDHRSIKEQKDDRIAEARKWIKNEGFEVKRIGVPEDGEYFVNYKITKRDIGDCSFYWFVPDGHYVKKNDRKILKAEYTPLYGTDEMVTNFDKKYRYYIVNKRGCPGTAKTGDK